MSMEDKAKADSLRADVELYLRGLEPSTEDLAAAPVIKNWSIVPRVPTIAISGTMDGICITTSEIVWVDRRKRWVRTRNTLYRLASLR